MSSSTLPLPSCDVAVGTTPGVVAAPINSSAPLVSPSRLCKVLHVINGEHYSGAERVQDLLAAHLPEFGYEVGFACLKPGRFPSARQAREAQLFELPMQSQYDLRVIPGLTRIIREEGFELVHAHTPRSAMVGRWGAWLTRVPLVYHVHSPTARDTTQPLRNHLNDLVERSNLAGVSAMITVSHSLARYMAFRRYDDARIDVVHNGVPTPAEMRAVDPPAGEWRLGTIALFRPRKGLEILLDALAILRRHRRPVRLRAVGPFETPEYEQRIKRQVDQLGLGEVIDWVGFTADVPHELAQMDLFVLPSLFGEGLPMVVLEAMAAGVPSVGTRVEGIPEAIDDGVNGLIAAPGDAADLARCVTRVVAGDVDWKSLRRHAITTHAHRFSASHMARGVAAVYDRVLRRSPEAHR